MKEYRVQVTQNAKVVAGIMLPILLVVPLIILLIFLARRNASDEVIVPVVIVFILVFFAVTWFMVRQFMFRGILQLKQNGFSITFINRNLFTPADLNLPLGNITNYWIGQHQGYRYMSFNTATKPAAFNVMPLSNSIDDITEFEELINAVSIMVEVYNNSDAGTPRYIEDRTMYETWWAKLLAVFIVLVMVGSPLTYFLVPGVSEAPIGKFFVMIIFGLPFLHKVYYHNYRNKRT